MRLCTDSGKITKNNDGPTVNMTIGTDPWFKKILAETWHEHSGSKILFTGGCLMMMPMSSYTATTTLPISFMVMTPVLTFLRFHNFLTFRAHRRRWDHKLGMSRPTSLARCRAGELRGRPTCPVWQTQRYKFRLNNNWDWQETSLEISSFLNYWHSNC